MKEKIIGIFVCMLLIATAVPVVATLKNSAIKPTIPSTPLARGAEDWTEMQKLLASDGAAGDYFGFSVSLSGDTAFIGAAQDNSSRGSVYVFTRTGTDWTFQQKLNASDGAPYDQFGYSVSLSGDYALIGAITDDAWRGSAYVFNRTGTKWTQQQKLIALDAQASDEFGYSVSLDGNTALIGAPWDDNPVADTGSAYVFTRSGTAWTQQAKLNVSGAATYDFVGGSVSVSGDTALIGAYGDDSGYGSAYVFNRSGTTWAFQQKLSGNTILDSLGVSVSLRGDTALIGAPGADLKGCAYVFNRTGATWTQRQKLNASDGAKNDNFGCSVSLSDDAALIGALGDDNWRGSAYIFTCTGTTWTQQQKLTASDGIAGDWFGTSVSLDGDTALIGAHYNDDNETNSGSAYVFARPNLEFDITGGIGVNVDITNNGTADANGVPWQIQVTGGILGMVNVNVNNVTDLPVGVPKTATTGFFLGLGPITITATVGDASKTANGIILFVWVIILPS